METMQHETHRLESCPEETAVATEPRRGEIVLHLLFSDAEISRGRSPLKLSADM